ncbi:MAG: ATP-dependent DNA helicase RecG [Mariniblastus sp.]|nr:ATP-dependent DNA helicase RecG [Mariniblastus sp.]
MADATPDHEKTPHRSEADATPPDAIPENASLPPSENERSAIEKLTQHVQALNGVGPRRAQLLEKLGLRTAADLLFFFPRSYQDFTQLHEIVELEAEQLASVLGVVDDIDQTVTGNGKHILYVLIRQENQFLRAVWFNQQFLSHKFQIGQRVLLRGKAKLTGGRFQMTHPKTTWLDANQNVEDQKQLSPIYSLTDGINQRQMRDLVSQTVNECAATVEEAFPDELREKTDVCEIETAIRQIHAPKNQEEVDSARGRLVYQELFILQLALAIRRHKIKSENVSPALELTPKIRSRITGRLPFELTDSQKTAFAEIAADMGRDFPMNRLLHGEVGSGKTAVALCAMLLGVAHGNQATLMAPTEILARQHYQSLSKLLENSRVRLALWTGSLKTSQRKKIAQQIEAGEVDLIIGTQAVVASKLRFQQLGLVVIDEQHKFGVRQRALMKQSGHDPHYLVMTATPIPRTISMTLFGDLDVSTLERTSGVGQKVNTYLGQEQTRDQWWEFFRKKLGEGRQGFIVAPLVDSGDDSDLSSAERMFESLSNGPLSDFRLDVLHGRQSPEQKDAAMANFVSGKTQAMVATGVIEVGINVPNATIMTIESSERFGLSQLHQLRGRVSRGHHPGYVCAFSTSDDPESNERLTAFSNTDNGFDLAEIDLQIRGPGNLFSTQQSGFPPLMIADLIRDAEVLKRAQQDARQLIAKDPEMESEAYSRLRQLVFSRYGKALDLSDVG